MNDDENYNEEENEDDDFSDLDLDNINELLDEGLEPPKSKRKMNPNSLNNLRKGGIDQNISKHSYESRKKLVDERLSLAKEDPLEYFKNILFKNMLNEEINLENLHKDLITERASSNQLRIRQMIFSNTQTLLLIGDALKAQPKQNKEENKKSVSNMSEAFEEFRKSQTPDIANDAEKMKQEIEKLRQTEINKLKNGEGN